MLRRFSSSISEIASSIISSRNNNDGAASQQSSSPTGEISATPRNEPGALSHAMISASKPISNSQSDTTGFNKSTSFDRQETVTPGRQNPFSRDINFLHDFYNEGVLLSSSQPTQFYSGKADLL